MKISWSSVGFRPPRQNQGAALGETPITLEQLSAFQTTSATGGYTKFANVPWGPCFGVSSWNEPTLGNALTHPVMDIYYDPSVPAPPGGRTVIIRAHANGSTKDIPEAPGSLWDYLVVPAMSRGCVLATIEFRHPVPNEALGTPHNDTSYCTQFLRAMSSALEMNVNKFHGFAQSRGNLLIWSSVSPDLVNSGSGNYSKTQSSWLNSIWGLNSQSTYNTTQYVNSFIDAADRPAAFADPTYNFNSAFGSSYDQIIAAHRSTLPNLCITYDAPFITPLPNEAFGTYPKATIDSNNNLKVHLPEFGKHFLQAYISREQRNRIATCDDVNGGQVSMADAVEWFFALDDNPGISAREARSIVLIRRLGGSLHYIPADGSGVYVSPTNPTPVTTVGSSVGTIIDGIAGWTNRSNTTSPIGVLCRQTTTDLRPLLSSIGSGRRGIMMDSVDDIMTVALPNTAAVARVFTSDGEYTSIANRNNTKFEIGNPTYAGKNIAAIVGLPSGSFDTTTLVFLRQFASEISGVSY